MKVKLAVVAAIVCVGLGGLFFSRREAPAPTEVQAMRVHFEKLLQIQRPEDAYAQMKREYQSSPEAVSHNAAHTFGETLYTVAGVDGFAICDPSFGFGCFHTFIPAAIRDKGTSVMQDFDESCTRRFGPESLGCYHGIGHGLMAYEGYTESGIREALMLCGKLSWNRPYGGCREGVYMEYNFRNTEADPTKRSRPFEQAQRFAPCSAIDPASRTSCYFSLPAWWQQAYMVSGDAPLKMGEYCSELKKTTDRTACFRGVGYALAPIAGFQAQTGIQQCDLTEAKKYDLVACREGLAWALYADPTYRNQAELACTTRLDERDALLCKKEYLFVIK